MRLQAARGAGWCGQSGSVGTAAAVWYQCVLVSRSTALLTVLSHCIVGYSPRTVLPGTYVARAYVIRMRCVEMVPLLLRLTSSPAPMQAPTLKLVITLHSCTVGAGLIQ